MKIISGLISDFVGRKLNIIIASLGVIMGAIIVAIPSFYLLYLDAYARNMALLHLSM